MSIKNIEDLRDHVLATLEKLSKNKIDLNEASITAKLSETTISSIKIELEYARLMNRPTKIPFIEVCHKNNIIEVKPNMKLVEDRK